MPVKNRIAEMHGQITGWRHDFHAHPELMFDTHRTAARVAELLRGFGCDEVITGIGRTGVVGLINGRQDSAGRVIGLRADMDALPITETTGRAYASREAGKMHACGHDGHMAMLLGAAQYLAETRNFNGRVAVIFQPAEEGGGGALEMCRDGLMDRFRIQEVYGLHNMPGLAVGAFATRAGPLMAASDYFDIRLSGQGGHAARPQMCTDTVVIAAQVVLALQTIASRRIDPVETILVSVCGLETDSMAHNVIAETVRLRGTVRTMSDDVRGRAETLVRDIVTGTAQTHGAQADIVYKRGYPVTVNAADQTDFAAQAALSVAGSVDTQTAPMMWSEDFSYMAQERPGAYLFMGNGDSAGLHHPGYDFNDDAIPLGSSWWAEIAERRMPVV